MLIKKYFICLLIVWKIVDGGILNAQSSIPEQPLLNFGDPAPPIKFGQWIKGDSLKGFEKGRVYILEFWATWCGPCIGGMPQLSALARKYRDQVTVSGISVWERGDNIPARVKRFVDSMGNRMDYNVAADTKDGYIALNWLKAAGEKSIPNSIVIDREGKIAWIGFPKMLEKVLPSILNGSYDIKAQAAIRNDFKLNTKIDIDIIPRMNTFMDKKDFAGNFTGALLELEKIHQQYPKIKYYPFFGHYTFISLIHTDPKKAVSYAKEWIDNAVNPPWNSIATLIDYCNNIATNELLELAIVCNQATIDNYPWINNIPELYAENAQMLFKLGHKEKAIAAINKAISYAKNSKGFEKAKMDQLESDLKKYLIG